MEDPFDSTINAYCGYSSSQEELFRTSLLARQKASPEPYTSPLSPTSAAFQGNGIIICSAPDTPATETVASLSGDEYKTPPEESRHSSSEEAPPLDLGLSQEANRTPKMVEIVSEVDLDSFRVGEKRGLPVEYSSKKIRVSVDSSVLVNTPNLEATQEMEGLEKVENGVNVNMDVETEECDVDSGIGEAEQMIDTDVIEDCSDAEENCVNNGGIPNVQQEQEEEEEDGGMEIENENGNRETVVDGAEDLSRQGKRSLPASWVIQNEGKREEKSNAEGESGNGMGVVMEVLRWLAEEEREKQRDQAPIDFLETAMRRGVTFTEPKWWHCKEDD